MSPTATTTTVTRGRRIAGATGIMMLAMLVSRFLGLIRQGVIAHTLGQKYAADVYAGAFQIPDLLFYLIAGGALSSAFIPVFTEKLTQGKEDEAWQLFSTVASVMFVVITTFVVLGEIFTYPLMHLVNPGYSPAKLAATVPLTRIILPGQICFFMGGLLMGVQYSRNEYRYPALGPNIYNLGIIIGGIVLARWLGMAGLLWGALAGAIVGNFVLQLWAVKKGGMKFQVRFDARHPDAMRVWKLMLPVILGVALPQVSIWVNRAFASAMGDGPQAAMNNAAFVMQVPLGVFAQAMAVAIFPTLSALAVEKKAAEFRATSVMGVRSLIFLTLPVQMFMLALAAPIIQILLQQGKFTADDTALAAQALRFYSIGTFAWAVQSVLSRSFYALHDTVTPVVVGSVVTFIFVPLNYLLMNNAGMGLRGLALATSIAAILHAVAMAWVLRRRMDGMEDRRLGVSITKSLVAAGASYVACLAGNSLVLRFWPSTHGTMHVKVHALVQLVAGMGLGVVVFLGVAVLLRSEEIRELVSVMRRPKAGSAPEPA